jgi:hypothetical protein
MEHTKHIWRAVLIILLVPISYVVIHHIAVPESFGVYGHYRADSVKEFMDTPVIHGDRESCQSCHEKQNKELLANKAKGKHATVPCENCHDAVSFHVKPDSKTGELVKIEKMVIVRSYRLCAYCHEYLEARPNAFPQVKCKEHVISQDAEFSEEVCVKCHDPHNPSLKEEGKKDEGKKDAK